jgi:hypothetical protein
MSILVFELVGRAFVPAFVMPHQHSPSQKKHFRIRIKAGTEARPTNSIKGWL